MLIGREKQQQELLELLDRDESQFCAIYGRRRVGKTYLVKQTFQNQFAFVHTGLCEATKEEQLWEFRESLRSAGLKKCKLPKTWFEAFHMLQDYLSTLPQAKKIVFIDELPWLDTPKSRFLPAFEHFWNGWANMRNDIFLIVCGSATSWILENIVNNHGGLHDRLTRRIHLQPFSLHECERYMQSNNILLSRKDMAEAYMIMGGVPYYWSYLRRGESLSQNIDRIFFAQDAPLHDEFKALYKSLFKRSEIYLQIVESLTKRRAGLLREEILRETGLDDNEAFQRALRELEECSFIRKYNMYEYKAKNALYQLIDNFTLFHYQHIAANVPQDEHYWSSRRMSGDLDAWAGLAFERLCLLHAPQIKHALGISGVVCTFYSWTYKPGKDEQTEGFQIDMLIDRDDQIINICEMKFTEDEYVVKADDDRLLRRRIARFIAKTETKKTIHPILITTYGLSRNGYASVYQRTITLDDLFHE